MIQVEELFIEPTATVLETLRKLDVTGQRILFIAPEGKLKAVITDGDIRKFFLRGGRISFSHAYSKNKSLQPAVYLFSSHWMPAAVRSIPWAK